MRWTVAWVMLIGLGYSTGVHADQQTWKVFPDQFESSIIEDQTTRGDKRVVRVEINQPLSESRLRSMARSIKDSKRRYDRMWIWFQFPEPMSTGGAAWATVTYEGNNLKEVYVHGPTRQQILDAYRFKDDPGRDVRQVWISFENFARRIVFFIENDRFYFETRYLSDLSSSSVEPERITASSLPLSSLRRFQTEEAKEYAEAGLPDNYWRIDSENRLRGMSNGKLGYVAYPVTPGVSRFPTAKVKRVSGDDLCKQDIQCWGKRHEVSAKAPCIAGVEYVLDGVTAYEWTDGWLESKFPRFIWKPGKKDEGILIYLGDSMKIQNAYGWTQVRYECDYDPNTQKVLDVRIKQ